MQEKLIESWLDSASERSYQPVFCQMLMDQGYTVIHSTGHRPNEYGKDVLAISPDGEACAFQLKGNPGKRLNLTQYREIEPQLREMIHQQIEHPSIPRDRQHRSFLITNGEIEELVQQAIVQANEANERDGYPNRKLETISRGQLLEWALSLEDSLWPSELANMHTFLEILTCKGNELFPMGKFHTLLTDLLRVGFPQEEKAFPSEDFKRRIASSALLTSVALKSFSEKENHWAVVIAWTMLSTYLIAACEKHGKDLNLIEETLKLAEDVIFNELGLLVEGVIVRDRPLVEGNGMADFATYPWRYTLLVGLCSFFWIWAEGADTWPEDGFKSKLETFLPSNQDSLYLWGESAIPLFLTHAWYLFLKGEAALSAELTNNLMTQLLEKPLYPVYYPAEDVIKHNLSESLESFTSPIDFELEEKVATSSFAYQFMLHMVQRNMKDQCKANWARYSKIGSVSFFPEKPWMFCLFRSEQGENYQNIPPLTGDWTTLQKAAEEGPEKLIPKALLDRPFLLWLWCIVCPYRAISASLLHTFKTLSAGSPRAEKN